jgi:TRAP-type C4-dicarboxylate transport system permease small subunit
MTQRHLPPAIARAISLITWTENVLLILMLALMVVLAATQIVLRNFAHTSIDGADDMLRLLVLWVAFLGAVAASREGKHIHVDAIARWLPGRAKPLVNAVTDLFTTGVCGVMSWEALRYVLKSRETAELAIGALPVWAAASILPLAFALIGLRYLLRLYHHARQALGREALE